MSQISNWVHICTNACFYCLHLLYKKQFLFCFAGASGVGCLLWTCSQWKYFSFPYAGHRKSCLCGTLGPDSLQKVSSAIPCKCRTLGTVQLDELDNAGAAFNIPLIFVSLPSVKLNAIPPFQTNEKQVKQMKVPSVYMDRVGRGAEGRSLLA